MQPTENLLKAIAVTAELTDTDLSEFAARIMAKDLSGFPENQVLKALERCRKELKGRLRISDVIDRIDDGRPGHEEAWAMIPKNESASVVWTREMAESFGIALGLIDDGDHVAARMAFIETYKSKCTDARNNGVPVSWEPSLGHDRNGRESVLMDAVEKGRLTHSNALSLLPYHEQTEFGNKLLNCKSDENGSIRIGDIVSALHAEQEGRVPKLVSSLSSAEVTVSKEDAEKRFAEIRAVLSKKIVNGDAE